jgi:hypothetical protein
VIQTSPASRHQQLDDLMDVEEEPDFESQPFKGTRVINSQSTEMIGKQNLISESATDLVW